MNADETNEKAKLSTDRERFSSYEQPDLQSPDIQDIHRAVLREQFEPSEGQQRVPILLFLLFIGIAMWGGYYLSEYDGNFQANVYDGPDAFRQMDLSQADEQRQKTVDPLVLGKRIYNNCVSCHQGSGEGVAGQYPPLNQSEWVLGDDRILSRILLAGLNGPIEVRGQNYNAQMPAWKQLSDRDIAAVLTYIRSAWDNKAPPVSEQTLASVRAETVGKSGGYTADELKALDLPPVAESPPPADDTEDVQPATKETP